MNHLQNTLSSLKNGVNAQKSVVKIRQSKKSLILVNLLKEEGFIKAWHSSGSKELNVYLKYVFGYPAIKSIKCLSKPSIPTHLSFKDLCSLRNSFGTLVLNTPYGLITKDKAVIHKTGGFLVCYLK